MSWPRSSRSESPEGRWRCYELEDLRSVLGQMEEMLGDLEISGMGLIRRWKIGKRSLGWG